MRELAINTVWREVESIPSPEPIFAAPGDDLELIPRATPDRLPTPTIPAIAWGTAGLAALVLAVAAPQLLWLILLVAAAVGVWQVSYGRPRRAELKARRAELSAATETYAALLAEADRLGPAGFDAVKAQLHRLTVEYEAELPQREQAALTAFRRADEQHQLQRQMASIAIQDAAVVGLGPARKATLAQHGILTAAQVTRERVQGLPGFGPGLTASLLTWREFCVRTFRYDERDPVTVRERDRVIQPYRDRRREIEFRLGQGRDELRRLSSLSSEERGLLAEQLAAASRALAQAQLNLASL